MNYPTDAYDKDRLLDGVTPDQALNAVQQMAWIGQVGGELRSTGNEALDQWVFATLGFCATAAHHVFNCESA